MTLDTITIAWLRVACLAVALVTTLGAAEAQDGSADEERDEQLAGPELFPQDRRFTLDVGVGGGFSFSLHPEGSGVFQDAPGLKPSWNLLVGNVAGNYVVNGRYQLGFSLPLGLVQVQSDRLPGLADEPTFGIGDLRVSASRLLSRETARRPLVVLSVFGDSGTTEHDSLGDGFASAGLGSRLQKSLGSRLYLLGGLSASHRFKEAGFAPGLVWAPSLGGGVVAQSGKLKIEAELFYLRAEKSDDERPFRSGMQSEAASDTMLSLRFRSASSRHRLDVNIFGSSAVSETSVGFVYTVPVVPWERFLP